MTTETLSPSQATFGFIEDALLAGLAGDSHVTALERELLDLQQIGGTTEQARKLIGKYIEEQIQVAEQQAGLKYRTLEMTADRLLSDSRWRRIAGLQYDITVEAIRMLRFLPPSAEINNLLQRNAELNNLACTAENVVPQIQFDIRIIDDIGVVEVLTGEA